MATANTRLVRTAKPKIRTPSGRRGMLPFSGLLIIFGILMFGSALAIPASRAIQEAEMRERIASFTSTSGTEDSSISEAAKSGNSDGSESGQTVAVTGDESEDEEAADNEQPNIPSSDAERVDASRQTDLATSIGVKDNDGQVNRAESDVQAQQTDVEEESEPDQKPAPNHIRVPSVGIDTEIVEVGYDVVEVEGQRVREWEVASYAAGHHNNSANPGEGGNIVVTGHNDFEGEVFRTLEFAEVGNEVFLDTAEGEHEYVIEEIHMRREVGVSMEERLATGQFMADMPEERVTLITCWPYGINDHRIIVVAKPAD